MPHIVVDLSIDPEEWLKPYQGLASEVHARARDGRTVRFPARILSRYFLRDGIHGTFRIQFDDQGKFSSIERVA